MARYGEQEGGSGGGTHDLNGPSGRVEMGGGVQATEARGVVVPPCEANREKPGVSAVGPVFSSQRWVSEQRQGKGLGRTGSHDSSAPYGAALLPESSQDSPV